jgi:hypothetical protein
MFNEFELKSWKFKRQAMKFGQMTDTQQVIYRCLKFIDDDSTLVKILQLNKSSSKLFKKPVYKQALLHASQQNLKKKRSHLWIKLLEVDEKTYDADYKAHLVLAQQDLN